MGTLRHCLFVACLALVGCGLFEEEGAKEAASVEASGAGDPLAPPPASPVVQPRPAELDGEWPVLQDEAGAAEPARGERTQGRTDAKDGERRVDLAARDVDVRVALRSVGELVGVEVDLSPWVRGGISIHLEDVHWRRALERIAAKVGEFDVRGRGDLVRIEPRALKVVGEVVSASEGRLRVRPSDGQEDLDAWLPADDALGREALAGLIGKLRPGARVVLVCFSVGDRLVLRGAAAAR